jgi:hypothetical protein
MHVDNLMLRRGGLFGLTMKWEGQAAYLMQTNHQTEAYQMISLMNSNHVNGTVLMVDVMLIHWLNNHPLFDVQYV